MGRAAAGWAEIAAALDELEFHWGSAYDIDLGGGMWTARRKDGKGGMLADPLPKGSGSGSRLTTRRCRCRRTCRERRGRAAVPCVPDGGPAAAHDLRPGTGPPGGNCIRVAGLRSADGRVRRAAVLSGPAGRAREGTP